MHWLCQALYATKAICANEEIEEALLSLLYILTVYTRRSLLSEQTNTNQPLFNSFGTPCANIRTKNHTGSIQKYNTIKQKGRGSVGNIIFLYSTHYTWFLTENHRSYTHAHTTLTKQNCLATALGYKNLNFEWIYALAVGFRFCNHLVNAANFTKFNDFKIWKININLRYNSLTAIFCAQVQMWIVSASTRFEI